MPSHFSLWVYFSEAGFVVKSVMLLLITASVMSWTFIIQRWFFLRKIRDNDMQFEERFWSGGDLAQLYGQESTEGELPFGLSAIFNAGFKEFARIHQTTKSAATTVMESVQRAMRIAYARESENLEAHLPFLASVGSTSPYIGLFGTVWGIMTAFHALGQVQQATIAMVAPGISEALVATALGLFAAIPAVLAYNRYANQVSAIQHQYQTFQEEFSSILQRQIQPAAE